MARSGWLIGGFGLAAWSALAFAADSQECRGCHREIYDRYRQTAMGRSFSLAGTNPIEDWTNQNRYFHAPSSSHFQMTRRDGGYYLRRFQIESGSEVNSLELKITHVVGSGARARSYLHQTSEGRLVELPVSWYPQEKRWGMSPGYDRANHALFRTVNNRCMFCHNSYPQMKPEIARQGWDADVRFPASLPLGIDCERCHGDGAAHIRRPLASNIVNPKRMDPARGLDVCMQCHLETTSFRLPETYRRFGRTFYSFRPGEPLSDYMVHFDHAPGSGWDDKFEIVSAAYRLRQSNCFLKSEGKLTCTNCHQIHGQASEETYRASCLQCHSGAHNQTSGCTGCHMPKRRTEDVVHVVMTDHRIQRRPPPGDLLAARPEKTDAQQVYRGPVIPYFPASMPALYLAIAQVKEKANLLPGIAQLERLLAAEPSPFPEPWFELAEAQAAAGKPGEARKSYAEALRRDPSFVQAENNLANLLDGAEAVKHYQRAIALDPGMAEDHYNLALTLRAMGDRQGTEAALRRAIGVNPLYAPAHRDLGALLLEQGRMSEARPALQRALAIDPADPRTRHNLGLLK